MSQFTQFRIWIGPHVFTHRIPLDYYSNDNIEWAHSIIGHSVIFLSHATMWNAHANFSKFENFSSEVMKAICRLDWLRSTDSKHFVWKCANSFSNIYRKTVQKFCGLLKVQRLNFELSCDTNYLLYHHFIKIE